jgi:hypothetical protein
MLHVGFTITGDTAEIVIKDASLSVIHHGAIALGESRGETAEWLACKAAIRLAGKIGCNAVKLYSDLSVITQLVRLDTPHDPPEGVKFPTGYGKLPQYVSQDLYHFYDAVGLLWTLFKGRWEAYLVEKERITG